MEWTSPPQIDETNIWGRSIKVIVAAVVVVVSEI